MEPSHSCYLHFGFLFSALKVSNSVPRQPQGSAAAAGSCTSTGKMSRKDSSHGQVKNDVESSIPAAQDVIKSDIEAKTLSQRGKNKKQRGLLGNKGNKSKHTRG